MTDTQRHNIVFLDFDCVMIPDYEKSHVCPNLRALAEETAMRMNNDLYRHMDLMDISAFLLDCPDEAVMSLRTICGQAKARVVVSSSWCAYDDSDDFRALLALRGLDDYFEGCIDFSDYSKADGIRRWVDEHQPAISQYVILDDHEIEGFGDHQVLICGGHLSRRDIEPALEILGCTGASV